MARYGSFKYGQRKYGTSQTGLLKWAVEIDWDRDGIFDGSNEARWMFSISYNRGRKSMLKSSGGGFQTVPPGKCKIKLRNNDGRYNARNTESPLYPYVKYGPFARIRVCDQTTGNIKFFFVGTVTDIKPYGYGADAYVEIEIEDNSRFLRSNQARTPISQGLSPADAINAILDDVSWPVVWGRDIDSSSGTIPWHWASGSKSAWSELEDISQSYLGLFFIAADGRARYIDRNTEPENVADLSQEILLKDVFLPQPYVNRRNVTRLKVHSRRMADLDVIYSVIGDPIYIEAGGQKTIFVDYSYQGQRVPARDVATPVATTDYQAFQNSDGTGTDRTANCTMTVTDFGDRAKVRFNNVGGSNFYVTKRQIRGKAIYEENAEEVTYPEDITTVEEPSEFVLDLPWQQSVNSAEDNALVLGEFLDMEHQFPIVKLEARPETQFSLDLFDVVTLTIETLGIIGENFRVGGIDHQSKGDNCQAIKTTLYLEPYISVGDYWTWPVTNFGVDTIFGAG